MIFPLTDLNSMSSEALMGATRTMLRVARVDTMHPAEEALIRNFYTSCSDGLGLPSFDTLLQQTGYHMDASMFRGPAERDMVLALAVMTAYADGSFSEAEQATVKDVAADLQLPVTRVDEIADMVKDHMLAQLAHLPDAGSVAKVAAELR